MIGHPIDCHCLDCAGPIVLDTRRIVAGFAGLVPVLVLIWLCWIMLPA
jgi:hypothetical protein